MYRPTSQKTFFHARETDARHRLDILRLYIGYKGCILLSSIHVANNISDRRILIMRFLHNVVLFSYDDDDTEKFSTSKGGAAEV